MLLYLLYSVVMVLHWPRLVGFGSVLGKSAIFGSVRFDFLTSTKTSADVQWWCTHLRLYTCYC